MADDKWQMGITEIEYRKEQADFLKYLDDIGVVLETVIFKANEPINDVIEVSKLATVQGLGIIQDRYDLSFKAINPHLDPKDYWRLKIFPKEEIVGTTIDFKEFLGDGYDLASDSLVNYNTDIYNAIQKDGFVKALLATPHGISLKWQTDNLETIENRNSKAAFYKHVIKKYLSLILGIYTVNDTNNVAIIKWSDNWSNYFDAGKEWWGSYCWTIYNQPNNTITLLVASTTD